MRKGSRKAKEPATPASGTNQTLGTRIEDASRPEPVLLRITGLDGGDAPKSESSLPSGDRLATCKAKQCKIIGTTASKQK